MTRIALALCCAALPAVASATAPLISYSTSGGFTAFSIKLDVYADGTVVATRMNHRGSTDTVQYTGYITAAQTAHLASELDAIRWTALPATLRASTHIVADMPTHAAKYKGHKVTIAPMGSANTPVASQRVQNALSNLSTLFAHVGAARWITYTNTGGWGINDSLAITRGGEATFSRGGRTTIAPKQMMLTAAQLHQLQTALAHANWSHLPSHYGNRPIPDGTITTVTVYDRSNHGKAVRTMSGATTSAAFESVRTVLAKIVQGFVSAP